LIATLNVLSQDAKSRSVTTVTVTVPAECEALLTYPILRASALDKQVNKLLSIASASQASQEKVNVEVEAYVPVKEYRIFIPVAHHQVEFIVTLSVEASVVIVIFVPATNVKVSVVESATTLLCPDTAIVENKF
jgi:hypothetical protein